MYVIKRVWETKPREARRVASLVAQIGRIYESVDQREPSRISFNGGTVPGESDRVYMEWTAPVIDSPYRGDNDLPDTGDIGQQIRDLTVRSWIEFNEAAHPGQRAPARIELGADKSKLNGGPV